MAQPLKKHGKLKESVNNRLWKRKWKKEEEELRLGKLNAEKCKKQKKLPKKQQQQKLKMKIRMENGV